MTDHRRVIPNQPERLVTVPLAGGCGGGSFSFSSAEIECHMDPSPKLRGRAFAAHMVAESRRWIERCESNGVSYAGPNGQAIREADEAELRRWETTLRSYP